MRLTAKLLLSSFLLLVLEPVQAEQQLDWNKLNKFIPSWPIVNVADAIPSTLIAHWESSAVSFTCPGITGQFFSFPTKKGAAPPHKNECDHLDSTLFSGMLCAAGYEPGCTAVRQAQRKDGEWFRSPLNRADSTGRCVKKDGFEETSEQCRECENTFSRDQGIGAMLYIVKKDDTAALRSWLSALERIGQSTSLCRADGSCQAFPWPRLCTKDQGCIVKNKSDGSIDPELSKIPKPMFGFTSGMCILIPVQDTPDYDLLALVRKVQLKQLMLRATNEGDLLLAVLTGATIGGVVPDSVKDQALAEFSATNFPLHLEATRVLLRMLINNPELTVKNLPKLPLDPANIGLLPNSPQSSLNPILLHQRAKAISDRQAWNPFYKLLADGPSDEVRKKIIDLCPAQGESLPKTQTVWRWETDKEEEFSKSHSMGWDCVFVGRLFNKMRVRADLAKELLALFDEFSDPLPKLLNDAQARLADVEKATAMATAAASAATTALKETRDFVNVQHAQLNAQLQQQSAAAATQANTVANDLLKKQSDLASKLAALANAAPCAQILIVEDWKIRQVDEPVCAAVKSGLNGAISTLNAQIAQLNSTALQIHTQVTQLVLDQQKLADKFTEETVKLNSKILEKMENQAINDLKKQQKILAFARAKLISLTDSYERATGYLKIWRRL